jgi:hypothetical protein
MTHKPGAATSSAPSCLPRRVCQLAILDAGPTHNEARAEGPLSLPPSAARAARAISVRAHARSSDNNGPGSHSSADKKSPSYFDGGHRFRGEAGVHDRVGSTAGSGLFLFLGSNLESAPARRSRRTGRDLTITPPGCAL